jgi:hypothetical protein
LYCLLFYESFYSSKKKKIIISNQFNILAIGANSYKPSLFIFFKLHEGIC